MISSAIPPLITLHWNKFGSDVFNMSFVNFVLLSALFLGVLSTPIDISRPHPPVDPRTRPGYNATAAAAPDNFPMPSCSVKLTPGQIKSGINGENYRWRNGFIVHPDRAFNQGEYNVINDALYELSVHLCIPVLMWPQDSNPTGDYVSMMRGGSGSGCWAYVGRLGGRQELNLQWDGCVHKYIVQHESIHALGFFHEQSRPDRDNHVNIFLQNASPGTEHNFDRYGDTITYDVPYDINSIMHYNSYDFSSNGQPTILAKDGSQVGSQGYLRGSDVDKIKRMYGC